MRLNYAREGLGVQRRTYQPHPLPLSYKVFSYHDDKLTKKFPKHKLAFAQLGIGHLSLIFMLCLIIICFIGIESYKFSFGNESDSLTRKMLVRVTQ